MQTILEYLKRRQKQEYASKLTPDMSETDFSANVSNILTTIESDELAVVKNYMDTPICINKRVDDRTNIYWILTGDKDHTGCFVRFKDGEYDGCRMIRDYHYGSAGFRCNSTNSDKDFKDTFEWLNKFLFGD